LIEPSALKLPDSMRSIERGYHGLVAAIREQEAEPVQASMIAWNAVVWPARIDFQKEPEKKSRKDMIKRCS
jgi:hypothetical protein